MAIFLTRTAPGLNGVEALHEIMRWENARGSEANRPVSALHTIRGPWSHVFREALRATQPQKGLEESTTTSQAVRSFRRRNIRQTRKEDRRDR
jgi:hypothetical protein